MFVKAAPSGAAFLLQKGAAEKYATAVAHTAVFVCVMAVYRAS
jgi:hypothetical protein